MVNGFAERVEAARDFFVEKPRVTRNNGFDETKYFCICPEVVSGVVREKVFK